MKYINKMIKALKLEYPVELRIRRKNRNIKNAAACYEGLYRGKNLVSHRITINGSSIFNPDERSIKTLIAHELVHAWQEEKGHSNTEIHGKKFAQKAAKMNIKFKVPRIYIPELEADK